MSSYDALVRCAAAVCGVPFATLAIVDRDRAQFVAGTGATCAEEVPLTFSLLAETLAHDDVFAVRDARTDDRFSGSPVVAGHPFVRLYAGCALRVPGGPVLGVLAVAGSEPGTLTPEQTAALRDLARVATDLVQNSRELSVLHAAFDEALDFVMVTDSTPPSQGGPFIRYVNRQLLAATGYTPEELTGKPYGIVVAENNDAATLQSITDNLENMRDNEKELLLRRKDGSTFWVEFASRPLASADGSPAHWVAVGRDITVRRRTHEEMAALVNAIDTASDHIEIYALVDGAYAPAFQNAASDPDASLFVETILNQPPVRERLQRGETVTLPNDGLLIRPLGKTAETVICVRHQPWIAAAS